MRFGITVPNNWGIDDAMAVLNLGPRAQELGYESIWVSDHLFNAGYVAQRLGQGPYYEPMTTLTYLAVITDSVRLGTSVLVLPYHHPVNLAKVVATLDVFSGGRLDLGLGAGNMPDEYRNVGVPFGERGAITDEAIEAMRALWTQDTPSFQGRYHAFSGLAFSPKPAQQPHPPLFIGGSSRPALRRAARVGDWWHPSGLAPEELRDGMSYLAQQARSLGRDPARLKVSLRLDLDFPALSGASPGGRRRPSLIGTPEEMVERVRAYEALGVEQIMGATMSRDARVVGATMELFAREVMPAFPG